MQPETPQAISDISTTTNSTVRSQHTSTKPLPHNNYATLLPCLISMPSQPYGFWTRPQCQWQQRPRQVQQWAQRGSQYPTSKSPKETSTATAKPYPPTSLSATPYWLARLWSIVSHSRGTSNVQYITVRTPLTSLTRLEFSSTQNHLTNMISKMTYSKQG